jgi:Zn-dependent peptidase ImmA (M78 family)/transcriptional regulator with XRE-family HTH domain
MGKFNPEMLILARGAAGLSQKQLAHEMGWSQGKASKVENGLIDLSEEECQRLTFLHYPVDFFTSPGLPEGFGSCCTFHRKRLTTPIRALDQLHDQINIRRIQVSRLLKSTKLPAPNFPVLDIDEFESPSVIAHHVRTVWKLPRGRIKNLVQVIEAAGGIIIQCDFPTPKIDAVSQLSRQAPPMFFLNRSAPVDRWRRSLAHELGHIVMHAAGPSTNAEEEAEEFASAFLLPDCEELRRDLHGIDIRSAGALKLKWRVSMQSLIMRAFHLGIITKQRYTYLFMRMSQLGYRKHEPHDLEQETPVQLRQIIELHRHEFGYSDSDLATTMLCTPERFKSEYLENGANRFGVIG